MWAYFCSILQGMYFLQESFCEATLRVDIMYHLRSFLLKHWPKTNQYGATTTMKRAAIHAADRSTAKSLGIGRFQGSKKYFLSPALLRRVAIFLQAPDDDNESENSPNE